MPDYKKKKVSRFGGVRPQANKKVKRTQTTAETESIKMRPSRAPVQEPAENLRVVKGKKLEKQRRIRITLASLAVLVAAFFVLNALLPVGLIENISNTIHTFGSGSYPVELSGSETVSAEMRGGYYYTLTDTSLYAFSNGGKQIYKELHGYSSPVLKTSETRALIFDQGGGSLAVYNLSRKTSYISDESVHIITAAISRSGAYAVATKSDAYASTVTVYDKNGKVMYAWNSAKDIVNSVAVSPSGKKLAVATVNASGGSCVARVSVFNFDSADPAVSFEISDAPVYSLENSGDGFLILTSGGAVFVDWLKYQKTDIQSELQLDMFRRGGNGSLLVFNRSNDKSDNTVTVLSSKGEKQAEISINGTISDIEYRGGHIYVISDTSVYAYNKKGELLQSGECEYGCKRFAVISDDELAVMTDNRITTVKITKGEG